MGINTFDTKEMTIYETNGVLRVKLVPFKVIVYDDHMEFVRGQADGSLEGTSMRYENIEHAEYDYESNWLTVDGVATMYNPNCNSVEQHLESECGKQTTVRAKLFGTKQSAYEFVTSVFSITPIALEIK